MSAITTPAERFGDSEFEVERGRLAIRGRRGYCAGAPTSGRGGHLVLDFAKDDKMKHGKWIYSWVLPVRMRAHKVLFYGDECASLSGPMGERGGQTEGWSQERSPREKGHCGVESH